jgi:large subunit ribosomal protein L19e
MSIKTIRRLASKVTGAGISRITFTDIDKAQEGVTTDDVRNLINEKVIVVSAKRGVSRGRARERYARHSVRSAGLGTRKGTKKARLNPKKRWIAKVRSQRKYLKELAETKKLEKKTTRKLYLMIKGNYFRSKRHMEEYINGLKSNL